MRFTERGQMPDLPVFRVESSMSTRLVIIDDLGHVWDGGDPRLRTAFGSTASSDEFSTYVVKNMGFIAVHGYGRSCEIRLRPQVVTVAAFSTLKDWLTGRNFERIVTACFEADWVYGLHASHDKATAKLDTMITAARGARPGDYLMRTLKKDDLPRTTPLHKALHSLIENWPMLSQSVHRNGLSNIIQQSLQGRYHVMIAKSGASALTFGEIGSGFVSYSDNWRAQAIGKSIADHEDMNYGSWVASNCHGALAAGTPTLCDVDAIMTTPKLGRARLRYKRLYLPARGIGGGTWLLTSSILDPTIDLRVNLFDKTG
jgi:hypothetical protein